MREERIIGNNIKLQLIDDSIDVNTASSTLGYTTDEMNRICEGRMYLSVEEIENIASYLGISREELETQKADEDYEKAGCIHYNHHFKNQANYDKIMDLFDFVCDVEEVI